VSAPPARRLKASVVYARPDRQWVVEVEMPAGATLAETVERSGLRERCPELAAGPLQLGVFHRRRDGASALRDGERIEIYRPLTADPKEARRRRAAAARKQAARGGR
jgi:hypothetical protein